MTDPLPTAQLAVTLTALSNSRLVAALSALVCEFCRALIADPQVVSRFHMAAQELAENLVKYSVGREVKLAAALTETRENTELSLRATNRSTPAQLDQVERCLAALVKAPDPTAHYDLLIREAAPREEGSGLGLARLRAEGELSVNYSIEGDQLTISVHASVEPRKGSPHADR
ncbi:MAG TPA: hypothetical protein VFU02_06255 [Polyangiaceae bacterium]|nr:hypothetical protein [Polyangiaceae bacterium]